MAKNLAVSVNHTRNEVKDALSSPGLCSEHTSEAVRRLLESYTNHSGSANRNGSSGKISGSKAKPHKIHPPTVKCTTALTIHEDHLGGLKAEERISFAIEVVNLVLQRLSDGASVTNIKTYNTQCAESRKSVSEPRPLAAAKLGKPKPSSNHSLQSRSVNHKSPSNVRTAKPPEVDTVTIKPAEVVLHTTAECGKIAYGHLRKHARCVTKNISSDDWNLENGMIAFIGKLISHGLREIAAQELKALKKHLELRISRREARIDKAESKVNSQLDSTPEKYDTISDLLYFEEVDSNHTSLPWIINYQLLVMRLILASRKPTLVDTTLDRLVLSCPSSPINMLLALSRRPAYIDRAAQQLEVLAQLILSLASPRQLQCDRSRSLSNKDPPSSQTVLCLQTLALQTRCFWIKLVHHSGNSDNEILGPLYMHLLSFEKSSTSSPAENLIVVAAALRPLMEVLDDLPKPTLERTAVTIPCIRCTLALKMNDFAHAAGRIDIAKQYLEIELSRHAQNGSCQEEHPAMRLRLATLGLLDENTSLESTLSKASLESVVEELKLDDSGRMPRVNLILPELMNLKNVIKVALNKSVHLSPELETHDASTILSTCRTIMSTVITYIRRCVNGYEAASIDTATATSFQHQLIRAAETFIGSISAFYSIRNHISLEAFGSADLLLQDCFRLLQELATLSRNHSVAVLDPMFVALSQTYWIWFSKLKGDSESIDICIHSAKKSCACLQHLSTANRSRSCLPVKLFKLATVAITSSRLNEAREALHKSITEGIYMGALREPQTDPKAVDPPSDSELFNQLQLSLERLLHLEGKEYIYQPREAPFYDDKTLENHERQMLLTSQLGLLLRAGNSKGLRASAKRTVPLICKELLDLYKKMHNSISHGRMALKIYCMALDPDYIVGSSILEGASETVTLWSEMMHSLIGNQCLLGLHLQISLNLAVAFFRETLDAKAVTEVIRDWMEIIDHPEAKIVLSESDIQTWEVQLRVLTSYCELQTYSDLGVDVSILLIKVLELLAKPEFQRIAAARIHLGVQMIRLGFSEQGGIEMLKAKDLLKDFAKTVDFDSILHTAQAEYYLALEDVVKCRELLDLTFSNRKQKTISTTAPIDPVRSFEEADLSHIRSLVLWQSGLEKAALYQSLHELSTLQRAWRIAGYGTIKSKDRETSGEQFHDDVTSLSNKLTKLTVDKTAIGSIELPKTSFFGSYDAWSMAPRIVRCLLKLSGFFRHFGMFQEATYQLQYAEQFAHSIRVTSFIAAACAEKGDLMSHSGSLVEGAHLLGEADEMYKCVPRSFQHAIHHCSFGQLHHQEGQWPSAFEHYDRAADILKALGSPVWQHRSKMVTQSLRKAAPKPSLKQSKRAPTHSKILKDRIKDPVLTVQEYLRSDKEIVPAKLLNMAMEVRRCMVESILAQGEVETALDKAMSLELNSGSIECRARKQTAKGRVLLSAGLKTLSTDSIFSMLSESTISLPAVLTGLEESCHQESTHSVNERPARLAKPAKRSKQAEEKHRDSKKDPGNAVELKGLLIQAAENTSDVMSMVALRISNETLLQQCSAFSAASMLTSSIMPWAELKVVQPTAIAYTIDLPRSLASIRERSYADLDAVKLGSFEINTIQDDRVMTGTQHVSLSNCQNGLINNIPNEWNVVSVSVDEAREYIYLIRLKANQTPFVMRLPLSRQSNEDVGEETFTFANAKAELEDIIQSSDATVHAARDNPDLLRAKGAKTKWWQDRESLDDRLRNLIVNIENIWLGGFRGILDSHQRQPELLARLQQSFELILEKYLPSRQKTRKRNGSSPQLRLSPYVLDLFVGLEHVCNDETQYDEALMDLLYYVVDILQFNGECNAYDEIDFDSMIVDTQDALQSHREAADTNSSRFLPRHTILILDKELHVFPWESLPCLEGQSVSRLTSFFDLHERISQMHRQHEHRVHKTVSAGGIFVSSSDGSCFLNPSGDLSKTQSRFESALSTMGTSWSISTNTAPTEEQFITALTPHALKADIANTKAEAHEVHDMVRSEHPNVLLYFGHGSGAQYVRSRRIKRLRTLRASSATPSSDPAEASNPLPDPSSSTPTSTCNVALLFGCSSVSLRVPGAFNAYGTPVTYLIAGAPAVLGSLWDVTDGDCDVFAAKVLEGWGLLAPGSCEVAVKGKGKDVKTGANVRRAQREKAGGGMESGSRRRGGREVRSEDGVEGADRFGRLSLGEAAARGRKECYLRYLNGAAMVVYGVPVFVDKR